MKKSPEAFRTISEVADALAVPPHVLRFWETRFAQVKPVKRGGGRRYYRPEDVCLLRGIKGLLYEDGLTIKGAQKILRERGVRHVIGLGTLPDGTKVPETAVAKPKSRPAKPPKSNGPDKAPQPRPQGDLFASPTSPDIPVQPAAAAAIKRGDKAALRTLVGELEALRAAMTAEPKG